MLSPTTTAATYITTTPNDRAVADEAQAIRLDPKLADAYNNRGWAYLSKGDYGAAIDDFTEDIRLEPNNEGSFESRGFAYYNKKDYDRAIADFDRANRLSPSANAQYMRDRAIRARGEKPNDLGAAPTPTTAVPTRVPQRGDLTAVPTIRPKGQQTRGLRTAARVLNRRLFSQASRMPMLFPPTPAQSRALTADHAKS